MADEPTSNTVVCVIFGGVSSEHDISQRSADTVLNALDKDKYELVLIGITKGGQWLRYRGDIKDVFGGQWETHDCTPAFISPSQDVHGLVELHEDGTYSVEHIDVVLPVLHGRGGEDGSIQGLFEQAGLPYVGCGILSSAMCMDKATTYGLVEAAGVRCPRCRTINGEVNMDEVREIAEDLGYPLFVKPANGGSSFGISKVETPEQLEPAVMEAHGFDAKICFESAIVGSEVGCAVLGPAGGELMVGVPDQITVQSGFFRIHQETKPGENKENSKIICPAEISAEDMARAQETAKKIYRALDCNGLARVDMFLTPEGEYVFNEVNTPARHDLLQPLPRHDACRRPRGVRRARHAHRPGAGQVGDISLTRPPVGSLAR